MPGLALTISLLVANAVTLLFYQRSGTVDSNSRYAFYVVTLGLSLGLGLNFFEVFKDMAKVVRWRILASRPSTVREVDLVLGSESLMKTLTLMLESVRQPILALACGAWLLLNILAQVVVAVLPVFYSLEKGIDSNGITLATGNISVPRLDCYIKASEDACHPEWPLVESTLAHTYGQVGNRQQANCNYATDDDILAGDQNCPYFARMDRREFAVRFADWDPDDNNRAYPQLQTGRLVRVSAAECTSTNSGLDIRRYDSEVDGHDDLWLYNWTDAAAPGGSLVLEVPRTAAAWQATTYVWNGTSLPQLDAAHPAPIYPANQTIDTSQQCGPSCATLFAIRDMFRDVVGDELGHELTLFRCAVIVSAVSNADEPAFQMNDTVARTAAASIALSGRSRQKREKPDTSGDWRQFALYPFGAPAERLGQKCAGGSDGGPAACAAAGGGRGAEYRGQRHPEWGRRGRGASAGTRESLGGSGGPPAVSPNGRVNSKVANACK